MPGQSLHRVLLQLGRQAGSGAGAVEDRLLLERFVGGRDERAFEAIVGRHGPMVLGVCRRLLQDSHDAEDAFQATFLILVRKAHSLSRRGLLAQWLYGVAYRTALKARALKRMRTMRERAAAAQRDHPEPREPGDVERVVDEEIGRLPGKYRLPVVLCYLEGKTLEQASRELDWPKGTVAGRMARAREMLRRRLTRRGLDPAPEVLALKLGDLLAPPRLPAPLADLTVRLGMRSLSAGLAAEGATASVMNIAREVQQAMLLQRLRTGLIVLLVFALAAGGGSLVLDLKSSSAERPAAAAEPPALERHPEQRSGNNESGSELQALRKALVESARKETLLREKQFEMANPPHRAVPLTGYPEDLFHLLDASLRLLKAEQELSHKKADQIGALKTHFNRMKKIEAIEQSLLEARRASPLDLETCHCYRIQAEIWLKEAERK